MNLTIDPDEYNGFYIRLWGDIPSDVSEIFHYVDTDSFQDKKILTTVNYMAVLRHKTNIMYTYVEQPSYIITGINNLKNQRYTEQG